MYVLPRGNVVPQFEYISPIRQSTALLCCPDMQNSILQLEGEEMNRILNLCTRPRASADSNMNLSSLVEEVSVDYLRTMNKIVLKAQINEVQGRVRVTTER